MSQSSLIRASQQLVSEKVATYSHVWQTNSSAESSLQEAVLFYDARAPLFYYLHYPLSIPEVLINEVGPLFPRRGGRAVTQGGNAPYLLLVIFQF